MPRMNVEIPEDMNKKLKMHQLKYDFKFLTESLNDVVKRFFDAETQGGK